MKKLISTALFALLLSFNPAVFAGPGYEEIKPAQNTVTNDGTVEVLEYFWFGCPHCFAFEPAINEWADNKPEHVTFIREAPPLNPAWLPHSQAFYAAEIMQVTDKFFEPMFDAIHVKKRNLRSPKAIAKFAGELGIDADKFLKTMKSFAVETRIRQSMQRARAAGINGVPSIIVNGKYRTGNSIAGSHKGIIDAINRLVEIEHKGKS